MKLTSKDAFVKTGKVGDVVEFKVDGDVVFMRRMSTHDLITMHELILNKDKGDDTKFMPASRFLCALLAMSLVTEKGERIFASHLEVEEALDPLLAGKLCELASELNPISDFNLVEIAKNSRAATSQSVAASEEMSSTLQPV